VYFIYHVSGYNDTMYLVIEWYRISNCCCTDGLYAGFVSNILLSPNDL